VEDIVGLSDDASNASGDGCLYAGAPFIATVAGMAPLVRWDPRNVINACKREPTCPEHGVKLLVGLPCEQMVRALIPARHIV